MNTKISSSVKTISIIFLVLAAFGGFEYFSLYRKSSQNQADSSAQIADLQTNLSQTELERTSLNDALTAERQKSDEYAAQIEKLSGKVGTLTKLTQTDPELLKKYSKVFFLNENYTPTRLRIVSTRYLFDQNKPQKFLADAWPYLQKLLDDADDEGMQLTILSAYRSFSTQTTLKNQYTVIYGAGTANSFSAEQGYSEHQMGTALDFAEPTSGAGLTGFERSPEYRWLQDNAYKYGFELSYPKGNTYYQYEPWHWRFVGTKLAQYLHDHNENFYDMDQRDIDKYLVNLFDPMTDSTDSSDDATSTDSQ